MHKKLADTLSQYTKIILVGGGTGGHIQPIVSLMSSLRKELSEGNEDGGLAQKKSETLIPLPISGIPLSQGGEQKLLWIGGKNSQEEKTAKIENIRFQSISTLKFATTKSWKILLYPLYLLVGCWQARRILKSAIQHSNTPTLQHSTCLFSKGGPGSVAIGIAAWSLSIPLFIHESDTIPGRSNRILAKFADTIFLGFASASRFFDTKKCEVVGQILDPVFLPPCQGQRLAQERGIKGGLDPQKKPLRPSDASPGQGSPNWKTTKPHILVICGSQGSQIIFTEIIKNYSGNNKYEWIISLGKLNSGMKNEFEKIPDCQACEWISQSDIAHLIGHTDLAITRGSATTLAELTVFGTKPKLIIIPLPYSANNHQYYNALEYEKIGHTVLEQKNLSQLTKIIQEYVGK